MDDHAGLILHSRGRLEAGAGRQLFVTSLPVLQLVPDTDPSFIDLGNIMGAVNSGIEFDWDTENARHLKRHPVTPDEFEELMTGDPVYLEYQAYGASRVYQKLYWENRG